MSHQLKENITESEELKINVPFIRFIEDPQQARRLKYRRRINEVKLAMHFGQRKLLLSEIEFLTNCGNLSNLVIYAGSAPGIHIPLLLTLFPTHKLELYDPAKFKIKEQPGLKIHNELFTNEIAGKYTNENVLFISDVRTSENKFKDEWEDEISDNMKMQKKWVEIMKPIRSMLKFRLPYFPGITKYYSGKLYFQPWAGQSSTEMRLITDGKNEKLYDHTTYEDIMFRHNRITRSQTFKHKYDIPGIDYCYDCFSEIEILTRYNIYRKTKNINDDFNLTDIINLVSNMVSLMLS
jgi:cap2 methyltransferase